MKFDKETIEDTILMTHKNCFDGSGSAIVFLSAGGLRKNIYYVPAGNGVKAFVKKNMEMLMSAKQLLIADVAPDLETMQKLNKIYDVTVIDHHKTALELKGVRNCHIDMSSCGTKLLYEFLFEVNLPVGIPQNGLELLVYTINDRDMWINEGPMTDALFTLSNFLGQQDFITQITNSFSTNSYMVKSNQYDLIKRLQRKRNEKITNQLKHVKIRDYCGLKYGYLFLDDYQSQTLHRVLEEHGCDVAVGIKLSGGVVSIRTTSSADASLIAQAFGGGGHARAAGHGIDNETMNEIIETIHPW